MRGHQEGLKWALHASIRGSNRGMPTTQAHHKPLPINHLQATLYQPERYIYLTQ